MVKLKLAASTGQQLDPPYPPDILVNTRRMELDVGRIYGSDTWALAPEPIRPWLLMALFVAWRQSPAGSLPGEAREIAGAMGMPIGRFLAARRYLLRGWALHSDGRLYHPVMTAQVLRSHAERTRGSYRRFWSQVVGRHGALCVYCREREATCLDHVIPRSRGGQDQPGNLVPACRPCNSSKGARTPEEWSR